MKTVLVMRRQLKQAEKEVLQQYFPSDRINYIEASPQNGKEWLALCRAHKPVAVVLPQEEPLPSAAMREGFVHIHLTPAGAERLVAVKPVFEPLKAPTNRD